MNLDPPPSTHGIFDWIWLKWLNNLYEYLRENAVASFDLNVSRGLVTGVSAVNKFGRCPDNVDTGVDTDIWDGADATTGNVIWDAPTQARTHTLVSTSANDADAGTGAYSVTVYGLTDWDTAEVSETVTLAGLTPSSATTNAYVIIHRMVCNFGANSTTSNAGVITATAVTDATITAKIQVGEGQTQMAIYGIPSTQSLYISDSYGGVNRSQAGSANISILFNPSPDTSLTTFLVKSTFPSNSAGETMSERVFKPPLKLAGPGIVKIQGNGSANNLDVSAGFGGYLVTE